MMGPAPEEVTTDFTSQIVGKLESPIAIGSFGEVYRCTIESKTEVAVKVFKIDPGRSMDRLTNVMLRELKVWPRLKHGNIVPLYGTARIESPLPALVFEWMPSGKLSDYLDRKATTITPAARINLVWGIAKGLRYLHSENVIHGDLHPGNVLIDGFGNPCLTDFGLATVAEDAGLQWTRVTTARKFDARWRAPEVIGIDADPGRPTFKSDIYSFGSVMFFIVSGDIPWKEKKHSFQICIELSKKTTPTRPDNISDYQWDLIQQCWSWEQENRPDATMVLRVIAKYRLATSTSYDPWRTVTLPLRRWAGDKRQHIVADFHADIPTKNIVLFGQTGSGKSSVVNLMAGEEIAETSPGTERCTLHWKAHSVTFDGYDYKMFDTIGIEDQEFRMAEYLEAIENAYDLVKRLTSESGIDLLMFCMRAGRVTTTIQANYRLFYEWLCEKKVPIVLILTGLERETNMEEWWNRNNRHFSQYDIQVAGHVCITASYAYITADNEGKRRQQQLYEESCRLVRDLVIQHTHGMREARENKSVARELWELAADNLKYTPKDIVTILTQRCDMDPNAAKELALRIRSDSRSK